MAKPMYAVKLSFQGYMSFAQWITTNDRFKMPPGQLKPLVEQQLLGLGAQVYEDCDDPARAFDANDKVAPHRDGGRNLNLSLPVEICKKADGSIDLAYLEAYVQQIRAAASVQDGAWALLGMYFLSRCR